jgi:hypothetical protein
MQNIRRLIFKQVILGTQNPKGQEWMKRELQKGEFRKRYAKD